MHLYIHMKLLIICLRFHNNIVKDWETHKNIHRRPVVREQVWEGNFKENPNSFSFKRNQKLCLTVFCSWQDEQVGEDWKNLKWKPTGSLTWRSNRVVGKRFSINRLEGEQHNAVNLGPMPILKEMALTENREAESKRRKHKSLKLVRLNSCFRWG